MDELCDTQRIIGEMYTCFPPGLAEIPLSLHVNACSCMFMRLQQWRLGLSKNVVDMFVPCISNRTRCMHVYVCACACLCACLGRSTATMVAPWRNRCFAGPICENTPRDTNSTPRMSAHPAWEHTHHTHHATHITLQSGHVVPHSPQEIHEIITLLALQRFYYGPEIAE